MDKKFIPAQAEGKIYEYWEKNKLFEAKIDPAKKPFTVILPPPNANGNLHMGHAMFVYEDIMIRYHKMKGEETFWLLGLDHAGIETQYVFEKQLQKQGKSRYDFDRETLFKMIWEFVMANKGNIKSQLRRMGFALDWSKEKFTMDEDIVAIVHRTFKKMFDDKLLYRAERLVNYCTKDGTSFSDLEVESKDVDGILYYINFPLEEGGTIPIATTRPETMLGDVAVMVNPKDKRYKHLIGKNVRLPITDRVVPIIADEYVDKKFGTGAVKVTPAHDFNDFEIAKKHKLAYPPVIGFDGRMQNTGVVDGMRVKAAREEVNKRLRELGLLVKETPHKMVVKVCYRCGTTLEPLPLEQWYIKIRPLADKANQMVAEGQIKIYPKRFQKILKRMLDDFIDWNISRQNVWGIRIPAFYCTSKKEWFVTDGAKPDKCMICDGTDFVQDTDTLDTWFSSGQWPFATLQTLGKDYYDYFYPTSVMETGHDILRAWISRMIMLGSYVTDKVQFENVFLHGMVRDGKGQKMSKSKGNVINPIEKIDLYGADALRAALIFGTKEGGDVVLTEDKLIGMRNFANKIWNVGRFIYMCEHKELLPAEQAVEKKDVGSILKELVKETAALDKKGIKNMEAYHFSRTLDDTHQFLWHRLADYYIEELKDELRNGNIEVLEKLKSSYFSCLKLLHPFMPFVTEAVWKVFHGEDSSLLKTRV
ncbi:MAG: valyl-tRNA synthetase, valyl-tRNA synthetase [Candidatus Parcubacteria bacterium]|jgi:valyl-tRNA synthetase